VLVAGVACKVESPNGNCRWRSAASPGSAGSMPSSTINLWRFCSLSGHTRRRDRTLWFLGSAPAGEAFLLTNPSVAWQ